jgi:cytochrome c553
MLPQPPDLMHRLEWSNEQLFWIVRHGLKYAGMPAWSGFERDDEIWAVVAFLRELPTLDEQSYLTLAAGNIRSPPYDAEDLTRFGTTMLPLAACARCHDTRDAPPIGEHVPRLGGQSREYIAEALRQYRDGVRESGFMEPVAADLRSAEIDALADFYAALESPPRAPEPVGGDVARGRELAEQGEADADIPACDVCHSRDALPVYPRLDGQPAAYLAQQLTLWREGRRDASDLGRVMAVIGRRLDAEQVRDVAAYYAQRQGRVSEQ